MTPFDPDRLVAEHFEDYVSEIASEATDAAVRDIVEATSNHTARDALGAWRAGYDYLDVHVAMVNPADYVHPDDRTDDLEEFTIRASVQGFPWHETESLPPTLPDEWSGHATLRRVDLRDLSPDEIERLREVLR